MAEHEVTSASLERWEGGQKPNQGEVDLLLALLAVVCMAGIPVLLCAHYGITWPAALVFVFSAVAAVCGGVAWLLDLGGAP